MSDPTLRKRLTEETMRLVHLARTFPAETVRYLRWLARPIVADAKQSWLPRLKQNIGGFSGWATRIGSTAIPRPARLWTDLREWVNDRNARLSSGQEKIVHYIAAAYTDGDQSLAVVGNLARAGFHPNSIKVIDPTMPSRSRNPRSLVLVHRLNRSMRHPNARRLAKMISTPTGSAIIGGLLIGPLMALGGVLLLGATEVWPLLWGLGLIAGLMSPSVSSALQATEARHALDSLGAPIGAVTVKVETENTVAARVAKSLLAEHGPACIQSTSWLGLNPKVWSEASPGNHTPYRSDPGPGCGTSPRESTTSELPIYAAGQSPLDA